MAVTPTRRYLFYLAAFPLKKNKGNLSEENRIINGRISRTRRTSESVFGILSSRFRVFSTVMCVKPEGAVKIVLCAIALHNFVRSRVQEN